ncbi:siphovirus Gp157 family protein [Microcoleus sp. PH2017_28_MFU_U_A]|uniref:siphovirus Gp157 family protein n=1 Tax=Microcoleus sp. PH2017_28_MFU_U_A TaxID=2798838 RepID=UPI001D7D695E|nr:siphovirus Gp157 family protein [Microcoleus sp. PH2017_28_MFU_U_A]MCC3589265.1 siphovirus Gp157 family protein [Microcoleus sp. PH2017_28_MFU_U_A]
MYLAKDSLARYSIQAVELWNQLETAETPEEEETILKQLWEIQTDQEIAVDTQAELADQLDAEICAVKARLKHLVELHNEAIERLERWRNSLDKTLLQFHSMGVIPTEIVGRSRHIRLKENPPSCEVLINPCDLPTEYRTEKLVVTPNKRKILADWKQGIPVDGTRIERKLRVEYGIVPSNLTSATEVISNRAAANSQETHSTTTQNTGRKEKAIAKSVDRSNKKMKARAG